MKLSQGDLDTLSQSVLFRRIPANLADVILKSAIVKSVDRHETLFIQGEPAAYLFVILEGWVKLTRITPAGEEVVVNIYSKGNSFGEAAALNKGDYPVTAEAVNDCRLLKIKSASLLSLLLENPELAVAFLGATFKHLHELVSQVEEIKTLSGIKRLATFLLAIAPVQEGPCAFRLPYDKALIAARLGIKPESLSRAFARLREHGVLVSRQNVAISRVEGLQDFIDDEGSAQHRKIAN